MSKNKILSESDINYLEKRLKETFPTKEDFNNLKDSLFNKLDLILKEVVTSREKQTVLSAKSSDHEDRIEALEEFHPSGKHNL